MKFIDEARIEVIAGDAEFWEGASSLRRSGVTAFDRLKCALHPDCDLYYLRILWSQEFRFC